MDLNFTGSTVSEYVSIKVKFAVQALTILLFELLIPVTYRRGSSPLLRLHHPTEPCGVPKSLLIAAGHSAIKNERKHATLKAILPLYRYAPV